MISSRDLLSKVILTAADLKALCRHKLTLLMVKATKSFWKLRSEAVSLKKHHPTWSCRKIAKHMGCSHTFVIKWVARNEQSGQLEDKHRSGRPPKADAAAVQHIVKAAQQPECSTAADIAAQVEQEEALIFSVSTIRAVLKKQGLQNLAARAVPALTPQQKVLRVQLARKYLRRDRTSKRRFLCTDSKVFLLQKVGRHSHRWCYPAKRHCLPKYKHTIAAHVYMGISYWGATKLRFVTGTHKHDSKYLRKGAKKDDKKKYHSGVASEEYNEVLRDFFVPEGNCLFAGRWAKKWQLQQDNAPAHKTTENTTFITQHVPGGHFLDWPPCSPDLSPIETMWAWMDHKLHKEYKPTNIEELKQALQEINESIPIAMLHRLFDGLDARMKRVIALDGDYIGK